MFQKEQRGLLAVFIIRALHVFMEHTALRAILAPPKNNPTFFSSIISRIVSYPIQSKAVCSFPLQF